METSTALVEKKKLSNIQYIVLYFFIYAFLGWVMETIYSLMVLGHFTKRGFLFGPLCPIYGFGAILMILFISKYKKILLSYLLRLLLFFPHSNML